MGKKGKGSFIWTSYSDLMTSLFFVMLVLFVVSIMIVKHNGQEIVRQAEEIKRNAAKEESLRAALEEKSRELEKKGSELDSVNKQLDSTLQATKQQLDKIKELERSIENIDARYFEYNKAYKRHTLKGIAVRFSPKSWNINDISFYDRQELQRAGRAIRQFMARAQKTISGAEYMLVVEGQSSMDNYEENDVLSYRRALSLVKYWKKEGIEFDDMPCEVIVSGSGTESKFRVKPEEIVVNGRRKGNPANQRFVIHIIPKPGMIED